MKIIVHGRADSKPADPETRQMILDESAMREISESNPIDAVETAINHLESSALFNSGIGGGLYKVTV